MATHLNKFTYQEAVNLAKVTIFKCKDEVHDLSTYNIDNNNPLDIFDVKSTNYFNKLRTILKINNNLDWEGWVSDYLKSDRKNYWRRFEFWCQGRDGNPNIFITTYSTDLVIVLGYKGDLALVIDTFNPLEPKWVKLKSLVPVFLDAKVNITPLQNKDFLQSVSPKIKKIRETFKTLLNTNGAPEYKNNWVSEEFTKQESEDMKNTKFTSGMFQTNKEALKEVGYLNAGRASNKILKEAVSPFVRMAFKPNFMQRVAMKLFKIENPADRLLKSEYSDLICAQLAQAIIELRGVENEHVREVAKAGIVYSTLKISEKFPLEEMMDKAVDVIEKESKDVVAKIKDRK